MDDEKLKDLYVESVRDFLERIGKQTDLSVLSKSGWEQAIDMVLEVAEQMKAQGFDTTTLEELKQRIV